jgi:Zn-dependent protease with chaperone function
MEPATTFWATYGPYLGVASYVVVFAAAAAIARHIASHALGTLRGAPLGSMHWTERNRRRHQEVQASFVLNWVLPLTGALVVWDSTSRTMPHVSWLVLATFLVLRLIVGRVGRAAQRATEDAESRSRWEWPGPAAATLLLFGRSFFLALVGTVVAARLPEHWPWVAVATVVVVVASNSPLGRHALVGLGLLRAPDDRLRRLVRETAERLGRPVPPCYEVRGLGLNALAWPAWQIVGVTRAALARLDDDDVRALLLHEFGHLAESRTVLRFRAAAAHLPLVFLLAPAIHGAFPSSGNLGYFAAGALYFLLSLRIRLGLSRTEDDADRFAAAAGGEAIAYARALEKLYRHNGFPAVQNARGLHSDLYDRLVALGASPDYPRPEAPSGRQRAYALVIACLLFLTTLTVAKIAVDEFVRPEASSTTLALNGWQKLRRAWIFGELARRQNDPVLAGELLDVAIETEPTEPVYWMNRAMVAAQAGDCGRAGARLMQGMTALERKSHVPASLALWVRHLEGFVSSQCGEGVARNDP